MEEEGGGGGEEKHARFHTIIVLFFSVLVALVASFIDDPAGFRSTALMHWSKVSIYFF